MFADQVATADAIVIQRRSSSTRPVSRSTGPGRNSHTSCAPGFAFNHRHARPAVARLINAHEDEIALVSELPKEEAKPAPLKLSPELPE